MTFKNLTLYNLFGQIVYQDKKDLKVYRSLENPLKAFIHSGEPQRLTLEEITANKSLMGLISKVGA